MSTADNKRKPISAWAGLIRLPNLVILACIQAIVFYMMWQPVYGTRLAYPLLVILMTVCAAASGYVINDIYDRTADAHNHSRNVLNVGGLTEVSAQRLYPVLIGLGFIAACVIAILWSVHFLWVYPLMVLLLWWYSWQLKHLILVGNIAVSVFCAFAILIAWWPVPGTFPPPLDLLWLAGFAGVVTLCREIVKDIEDMPGDRIAGSRTLPLVAGEDVARIVAVVLLGVIIATLGLYCTSQETRSIAFTIACPVTIIILTAAAVSLMRSNAGQITYRRVSMLIKLAMLTGALAIML